MKQTSKKWLGTLLSLCLIGALLLGMLPMSLVGASGTMTDLLVQDFETDTVAVKHNGTSVSTESGNRFMDVPLGKSFLVNASASHTLSALGLSAGDEFQITFDYRFTNETKLASFISVYAQPNTSAGYSSSGKRIDGGNGICFEATAAEVAAKTWKSGSMTLTMPSAADYDASKHQALRVVSSQAPVQFDNIKIQKAAAPATNFDGGLVYDGGFELQKSTLDAISATANPTSDKTNWYTKSANMGVIQSEGNGNTYLSVTDRAAVGLTGLTKDRLYSITFRLKLGSNTAKQPTTVHPRILKGSTLGSPYSVVSAKPDMTGANYPVIKTDGINASTWTECTFYYKHTQDGIDNGYDSLVLIPGAGKEILIDAVCVKEYYFDPFDGGFITDGGFNNQTSTIAAAGANAYPKTDSSDWYTKTANKGVIKAEDDGNKYLTLSADRVAVGLNQAMEKDKIYLISFKIKAVSTGTKATRLDPRMLKGSAPTSSWSSGDYTVTTQPTYSNGALSGNGWLGSSVMNALSTTAWSEYYFFYKHTEENISKGIDSLMFIVSGGDILLDAVLVQEYVPDTFDGVMVNDGGINNQGTIAARSASGKNPSNDDDNWYVKTAGKATVKADSSLNNYLEFTDRVFVGLNQALVKDQYYKISFKLKAVDATTALKALYIRMYNGANDNYANTYNVATGYASNDNVIGATEMKQRVTNTDWTEFTFYYQHGDEGVNEALDSLGFIYGDTTNPILLDEVLVKPYNVQTFDGGLIKDGGINAQKPVLAKASASANSETDDTNWYVATENAAQVKTETNDNNYLEFTDRVFVGINGDLKKDQLYKIAFRVKAPTGGAESLQALYIRMYDGAGRSKYGDCSDSFDMGGNAYIGASAMKQVITDQEWVDVTYYYLHTQENIDKGVDSLGFVYGSKATTLLLDAVSVTEFTAPDFGDAMIIDPEFDNQKTVLEAANALVSPTNDKANWYSKEKESATVKTEEDGNKYLELSDKTDRVYIGLNQELELNAMYKLTFRVKKANENVLNEAFYPRIYDSARSKYADVSLTMDMNGNAYIGSYQVRTKLKADAWTEYTFYYQHTEANAAKKVRVLTFILGGADDQHDFICLDSVNFVKMQYGVVGDKATASYTGALFNEMNLQKLIDKKSDLSASKVYKINAKPFNMYTIGITAGSSKVSNSKIYLSFDGTNVMPLSEANAPTPVIKADGTRSRRYSYEILTDETGVIYLIVENDDKALQIEDITVFQSLSRSTQLPIGVANDPNVSLYAADTLKELRVVGAEDADTATDASPETGEAPVLPVLLIVFALALSTAVLVMLKKGGAQA